MINELLRRLGAEEDQFVERKAQGAANRDEITKTVVAFANSVPDETTGILYIGVSDRGQILGVENTDSLQKKVAQACGDIYPPVRPDCMVIESDEKYIVAVVVRPSHNRPHFGGPAWVRQGSQTVKASEEVFGELIASRTSKVREILKWKNKLVTLDGPLRIGGRRIWTDRQGDRYECFVSDCDVHRVRLQMAGSDQYFALSLVDVEISSDEAARRLQLNLRSSS